jgi:GH15 family glucan-1,4-alpha-glucosidase
VSRPIEDYGFIGDLHTCALVSRGGDVDWLCFPAFDSAACFAALLGTQDNGRWTVAPARGGEATTRRYRGDTLILESEWTTPDGTVRVIDFMPPRDDVADLVRIVEGVDGRVPMRTSMRIRFDYGHIVPWVTRRDARIGAIAGPDALWFDSPVEVHGEGASTVGEFEIAAGQRVGFVLSWTPSHHPPPRRLDPERALEATERYWNQWISRAQVDTHEYRDAVVRSLITLKALTYLPTGAIVAAATTSLPEELGGSRNWDYRYCWLRDATMTLHTLVGAGYHDEAKAWRDWLIRTIAGDPKDTQIMYGLDGRRRLVEFELDWLPGYAGSTPVRVGNAASDQLQLDVYGEVMDALEVSRGAGLASSSDAWTFQQYVMDHLETHWREPDDGIWEVRGGRRQFTHSKVMAWVAVDRAIRGIEQWGLDGPVAKWHALRDEIHEDVLRNGFDRDLNSFVQSYGSTSLDAALLLIPSVGFLPGDDPRVIGTIEAVQRELQHGCFVRRYQTTDGPSVDGVEGSEGSFIACSFWLADALCLAGRTDEARRIYDDVLGVRNDLGLISEEYDHTLHRMLGNVPQAYSHLGIVTTAANLAGRNGPAHRRAASRPPRD